MDRRRRKIWAHERAGEARGATKSLDLCGWHEDATQSGCQVPNGTGVGSEDERALEHLHPQVP